MIQLWSAIAVALLTVVVGPLLRGEVSGKLHKRIAAHADLREKLEGNKVALTDLDDLLNEEVKVLRDREVYRLTRQLNGGNVAALVIVALVGGAIVYGLVSGGLALQGSLWSIALYVAAALVGLFAIALAAVGLRTLYEPRKQTKN
ncbi:MULTISPECIES: hypothetical protein [unclassified Microbacterium]|uniref:hypothetical protein n=1 Tax=unclassified Microbacterium TaxID=2609290 RepID=UPI000CFBEC61|nr:MULTISPECIES: hypothetical protein [unclassified Microbacterium]PQZ51102.1 hypothetical protein CQ032_18145 [Microbacterium sp. MYb43]PQZ73445.1 hypothetical protein CQ031_17410 [Microbacterium sp. MYb40]PRB15671.1 hypothetical protein CQ040_18950 [Microbacterium sp. MYb54]PRB22091.1 hypothetical protein CQ037_18665 [Microbacterium sp. MYb50]PRB60562.1 hypothetical protein CQ021_18870 [Microbacterium sp. MYb24]